MDLLSPLRHGVDVAFKGAELASGAVKIATVVPRLVVKQLTGSGSSPAPAPTPAPRPPAPPRAPRPSDASSNGVAGTAASVSTPDLTPASKPRTARRPTDAAPPRARPRRATTPKRSQIDRRRAAERAVDPATEAVETEGSAAPGANLRVDEPWPNYGKMKAPDIVDRLRTSDEATKAVVRLYEQTHKKRKSILDATGA